MSNRLFVLSAVAVLGFGLFLPTAAPAASTSSANAATATSRTVDQKVVTEDFIEALTVVEQNYAGKLDYARVSKSAIYGMLKTLDPHSSFYDAEEFEAFRTEQQSQYFGIGATIGARNNKVYITAPFPETPAFRAGLRYGDQIVEVDGKSTAGWSTRQVSSAMRGPRGTKVTIKVERPGTDEPITVNITRDAVPLPTITNAYMIAPGVGYIHLARSFNFTTSKEVRDALEQLEAQGMTSLVFDLRDNPGGLVREAVAVASDFLYRGQGILSIRGRSGGMRGGTINAISTSTNTKPLVVLVNQGTASASEIVAGALQDHDRALIIGTQSFGKGLVQSPFELEKNRGGLILTTGKYYTPSGRLIQRDYSNLSFYDYYLHRDKAEAEGVADREVFHTDSGRPIYGGGGISPDIPVEVSADRTRQILQWYGALFAFTAEVINGRVAGFESYRLDQLVANHVVKSTELVVTDAYLDAFKKYVAAHPELGAPVAQFDAQRELLRSELRRELVTAHYGVETSEQIVALTDPQVQRALKEMPQAEEMALAFRRNRPGSGGGVETSAER